MQRYVRIKLSSDVDLLKGNRNCLMIRNNRLTLSDVIRISTSATFYCVTYA